MSYVGITIQILEYHPQNYNYANFSFIFTSESRDFEKEISFSSKNSISHKISLPRKNLKYSIKITRNNSLIGISDFIIPFQIFSKKESFYNKTCQMTMTDSIRRLIFGNISPNNIKINVNANLQYLEKGEKFMKPNASNNIIKKEGKEKRASTPKKIDNKYNKNKYGNLTAILKLSKEEKEKCDMNKKLTEEVNKKRSNSKPLMNNISGKDNLNLKNKYFQKGKEQKKEKEKIKDIITNTNTNNIINNNKNDEKNIIENFEDTSDIDEDLKNNKEFDNKDLSEYLKNYINEHPLEKMDEFKEPYELMIYTKNNINELLNYQLSFYSTLNNSLNINKKFNNLLFNYNEKYRLVTKKINKTEEELKKDEIKEDLIKNNKFIANNNIEQILPLKQRELDLYKEFFVNNRNKNDDEEKEKYNEEQMKQIEEKKAKDANTQLLLTKILKNIYNKYGPLNNLINKENSDENEIKNILNLSEKYNLPISEEVLEMENVVCNNPDELDTNLEMYLKNYYKNKNMKKINFKKIDNNLYEYGNIKVNIFIENNEIKVKTNDVIQKKIIKNKKQKIYFNITPFKHNLFSYIIILIHFIFRIIIIFIIINIFFKFNISFNLNILASFSQWFK